MQAVVGGLSTFSPSWMRLLILWMNVAKDLGQSRGFDIHESKCGNGASLDFKCLPLLLLSAVGDRDLSAITHTPPALW